ncbi:FAD-dependent oxidoreductase [Homoserinimonas sp. OAct 916]|uniref:oxidoreductase n=1 Tax=Homoserinimonas sp. OAct 916 TaxID=2211450 RepID=UPI0018E560A2|nr:FAD-dependent oxidoreductase [Homoserinimonas sp. OAct 916]
MTAAGSAETAGEPITGQAPHAQTPQAQFPYARSPVTIGTLALPHRIMTGSMHLNLETVDDGEALAAFYAERVAGGTALIVTGGAAVNREGAGGPGYMLINEPRHQERLAVVVDAVHAAGGKIALQLFHAGRYALPTDEGLDAVAPSAVYSTFSRRTPVALDEHHLRETIADFARGAEHAARLGFDAVEVMGSEGYLLNQFVSPLTNRRKDRWGGDAGRRLAFPVAVVTAVRAAIGILPLLVRLSGDDLMPGSSTEAEVDDQALTLVAAGADALDIGIGWHESRVPTVQTLVPHGIWVDTASRIRGVLRSAGRTQPVIASGRINKLEQAETILAAGHADLISMARPFLADPEIVAKSFSGRQQLVNTCIGCNEACIDRSFGTQPVSCLVNPRAGREREFEVPAPQPEPARSISRTGPAVAVVGAGPAGMEAARALAAAGARVSLFEADARIGGQFLMAGMVPGKADFLQTVRYFENELERLGVQVLLNARVNEAAQVAEFDHVIIASGVRPREVWLPGGDEVKMVDYATAFRDPDAIGERVAIIGAGGIGVDLAHLLVECADGCRYGYQAPGSANRRREFRARARVSDDPDSTQPLARPARQITLMRRSGSIGRGMGVTTRWAVVQTIRAAGVRTLTGVDYLSVEPRGVWISADGNEELVEADTLVLAAGQESLREPARALAGTNIPHTVIGGARRIDGMNAVAAFEDGLRVGTAIGRGWK